MKFFAFLLFMLASSLGMAGNLPISVSASLGESDGEMYIAYDLKNNSDHDIEVHEAGLPWGNYHSVTLKAYAGKNELQRVLPIADPGWNKVVIKGGAVLSVRSLPLSEIFPELNESLKENDVLIIWSYDPSGLSPISHGDNNHFEGKFIIPKQLGMASNLPFSFSASLVESDGEIYISCNLKNNSDRDIEVRKWSLPWMSYNIDLKAYAGGKKLQRMMPIADPDLGDLGTKTLIKSRIVLSEKMGPLSAMFPEMNESLKKNDVLIIWSYDLGRLGDVNHGDGNRSGKFMIPKNPEISSIHAR